MKLLVLSDVHGNWSALQAVLNAESDAVFSFILRAEPKP
jgi:predicted phosphodiesterase